MAKTAVKHGAEIETFTPAEAEALIRKLQVEREPRRVRATQIILLDGTGAGQDEVYTVPVGFEFEARRVVLDLDTASDPTNASVVLPQGAQSNPWRGSAVPGPNIQANFSMVAPGPGLRHVAQYFTANIVTDPAVAPAASVVFAQIRASSGGTIFWQEAMSIPAATNQAVSVTLPNLALRGSTNAAMWFGFSAAPGANATESVFAAGYDEFASGTGSAVPIIEYLRSGTRIEYGVPMGPSGQPQVPGVQTWGAEQGPYLRNGETFEVRATDLTNGARLSVTLEGILRRPVKLLS